VTANQAKVIASHSELKALHGASGNIVRVTPVFSLQSLSERCGGNIRVKAENATRAAARRHETARVRANAQVGAGFGSMIMHCLAVMRAGNSDPRRRYQWERLASGHRAANLARAVMREFG
jgi:hypothetical protein